jgi:cell division protein FtsQ
MNRNQPTAVVPFDVKLMNITATVMFMGCLTACVMAVGWWLMRTPAFNIGRIVVEGELVHNNAVTLRANVAPVLKGNFFTVDLKAAQHAFEQVPWVQEAQVRREYPNGLRVALKEHVAEAFWGLRPVPVWSTRPAKCLKPIWANWTAKVCRVCKAPRARPRVFCRCIERWSRP